MTQSKFSLNGRIWIDTTEGKLLGIGRVELLQRIKVSGSIRQAALQMKMSYKQAWDMINQMNERFGEPLVISHRGGKGGGNAVITEFGEEMIVRFQNLQDKFQQFLKDNCPEI
jgi:molybdate transport system regulatory protein